MTDLQTALQALYAPLPKCPRNYRYTSIAELYAEYRARLEGTYVEDSRGTKVYFLAENFPHLVKLEFYDRKAQRWVEAVATPTIRRLRENALDEALHRIRDTSRPRTLFWIPEVIASADAIHDHKHKPQLHIHTRRYARDKGLDPLKFVLVETRPSGLTVIKTSFWTHDRYLQGCARMPAVHTNGK